MTVIVDLRHERDLLKLLKKVSKRDVVAVRETFVAISQQGIAAVRTDSIGGHKGLKEIIVKADNEYRIFFTQRGETVCCLAYCKKTSPQEQDRAIKLAAERMARLRKEES